MGREVLYAITNGRLDFGPWEQIFYYEKGWETGFNQDYWGINRHQ
jgi:thiamine phosphate synthase YjbQ (UPF0047 family)